MAAYPNGRGDVLKTHRVKVRILQQLPNRSISPTAEASDLNSLQYWFESNIEYHMVGIRLDEDAVLKTVGRNCLVDASSTPTATLKYW